MQAFVTMATHRSGYTVDQTWNRHILLFFEGVCHAAKGKTNLPYYRENTANEGGRFRLQDSSGKVNQWCDAKRVAIGSRSYIRRDFLSICQASGPIEGLFVCDA